MDILFFVLKYIPFWAIPLMMISLEFAYVYWLKSFRDIAKVFLGIALLCVISIGYYVAVGGPKGVTDSIYKVHDEIKR